MQSHPVQPHGWLQIAIPVAIVAVVFLLRARRLTQERPLAIGRLWVVPALYFVVVAALYWQRPPNGSDWIACAAALLAGAALGWQRGKTMRITLDPATGGLRQKGSIAGIVFLAVLVLVKSVTQAEGALIGSYLPLLTDAFAALALGMFGVQRLEMFLRARRMLADR